MASKYQDIIDFVRKAITDGTYTDGARLPSESELTKQFGASRPTVAKALRELQLEGMIDRRAGSGSFVTRAAPASQRLLFGLLIPGLGTTEIFEAISSQIARGAEAGRHGLLWSDFVATAATPSQAVERTVEPLIRQKVSGVFFAPLELSTGQDRLNREVADRLGQAGIPIILLDRDLTPFPNRSEHDLIGIDNYAAGYLLGQHLVERGCRRVSFVARPQSAGTVDIRAAGVAAALKRGTVATSPTWPLLVDPMDAPSLSRHLGSEHPDAIVCANDKTAAELMRSLGRLQVKVPTSIKVAAFDDVRYASLLHPPLTTVHQPCSDLGMAALDAMLSRIENPDRPARQISLPVRLVVRESTDDTIAH